MTMPALAGHYAVVTVGLLAIMWAQAKKQWKVTPKILSDAFWEEALQDPEVFAEFMTHWSDKKEHL